MKSNGIAVAIGCLALLLGPSAMRAQSAQASAADKAFAKAAMQGGMAEVKLGQLASEKAGSENVKQFGQKMVDDHTKLNEQMKPIAAQLNIQAPTELSPKDQALEKKLQGLSGEAFDKAYMSAMVKDHRKDLMEFKREAATGKDSQLKNAAKQGAEVIKQHLQLAEQVARKVGVAGSHMSKNAGSPTSTPAAPQ